MPQWLKNAVFYEIYPQSFFDTNGDGIGDINGITAKLDYVKSLGFNALWLNPCYLSPFMDAGYDVADYKTVAPRYGTNEDLYNLFNQAHERGMHVILDLVPGTRRINTRGFCKASCRSATKCPTVSFGRKTFGSGRKATCGFPAWPIGTVATC